MRMLSRSIPVAALALSLGALPVAAQEPGNGNFQWYVGGQGGVMFFDTPTQDRTGIPTFGGQTLIVAKRTGLLLSVEEGVGSDETSAYSDLSGTADRDVQRHPEVLRGAHGVPDRAAAQPYLGVGYGIMHVVSPTPTNRDRVPERRRGARQHRVRHLPGRHHLPGRPTDGLRPVPDHHQPGQFAVVR